MYGLINPQRFVRMMSFGVLFSISYFLSFLGFRRLNWMFQIASVTKLRYLVMSEQGSEKTGSRLIKNKRSLKFKEPRSRKIVLPRFPGV